MKLGTNQPMGPLQLADFIGAPFSLSSLAVYTAAAFSPYSHLLIQTAALHGYSDVIGSRVQAQGCPVAAAAVLCEHTAVTMPIWRLPAGLDTCLSIMRVLQKGTGDSKYRPCPLLVQYVDAGSSQPPHAYFARPSMPPQLLRPS